MGDILERNNKYYPKPILYDYFEKINNQVKKNICQIKLPNEKEGLGLFFKIPFPDKQNLLPVLITQSNIIKKEGSEEIENIIKLKIDNNYINLNLKGRKRHTNKLSNISIIDIKGIEDNKLINYFELDDKMLASFS